MAFGWVILLPAGVAPFVRSNPSDEVMLAFKIITTGISTIVVLALVCVPRKWWKLVSIPFAGFLVLDLI